MAKKPQKVHKLAGFISKLIEIIQSKPNEQVVTYSEQERSITIKNIRRFTEEILPKYFKHRNYSSFIRQINLYDFHKIRQQGKEEVYQNISFCIGDLRELKKIKRKPMGKEKQRKIKKKNKNVEYDDSDSEQQHNEDVDYEYQSDQQQFQARSQQHPHQCQQGQENKKQSQVIFEMQELQKKKTFLQNKIRLQQIANQKLEYENNELKSIFFNENMNFFKQTLKILQNLIISQLNQRRVDQQTYEKIMIYVYEQQQILNKQQRDYQCQLNKNKQTIVTNNGFSVISNTFQKVKSTMPLPICKQSKFFSFIKELLTKYKNFMTIDTFIVKLRDFIINKENLHHPSAHILTLNQDQNYSNQSIKEGIRTLQGKHKVECNRALRCEQNIEEKQENYSLNHQQRSHLIQQSKYVEEGEVNKTKSHLHENKNMDGLVQDKNNIRTMENLFVKKMDIIKKEQTRVTHEEKGIKGKKKQHRNKDSGSDDEQYIPKGR